MRRVVNFVAHRPVRLLVIAGIVAVTAGVVGAPVQKLLVPSRADFNDPGAESGHVDASVARALGQGPAGGVVALLRTPTDVLTDPASRQRVRAVAAALRSDTGVVDVSSALGPAGRAFVSRDGRATYLLVTLKDMAPAGIRDTVVRLQTTFERQSDVTLGGTEVAYAEASAQSEHDLVRSELIALPLLLALALVIFRGVIAALLPLVMGGLSIVLTLAAMRLINDVVALSNFALNLVTALALALSIDYSLFIVSRFREELAGGASVRDSLATTMRTAGRTVALSALTVGAALASLLLFPQRFLYSMGISGALVALASALVALTVLPALLALLGPRINALSLRRRRRPVYDRSGPWYRLAMAVQRRPVPVVVITTAVLVVMALPALSVSFIPFSAGMLPQSTATRQVDDALRTSFAASGSLIAVTLNGSPDPRTVTDLSDRIGALPGAAGVTAPRRLGDSSWLVNVFARGSDDTEQARELVSAIRGLPDAPGLRVGGVTATSMDKLDSLARHLPAALALLAATTFLLLFVLTGSVVLPLKALLVNLLTIAAAFGVLVLVFQDGNLHELLGFSTQNGLEATQPVLLFALAFGLSTDYGIFLLARITEAHRLGVSTRDAAALGLQKTGGIITAAAVLFCVAIGALALSPLVIIKLFGVGTTVAVLLDATIARALLVPALIGLLGRYNWWAPSILRRLHDRLNLAGTPRLALREDAASGAPGLATEHAR